MAVSVVTVGGEFLQNHTDRPERGILDQTCRHSVGFNRRQLWRTKAETGRNQSGWCHGRPQARLLATHICFVACSSIVMNVWGAERRPDCVCLCECGVRPSDVAAAAARRGGRTSAAWPGLCCALRDREETCGPPTCRNGGEGKRCAIRSRKHPRPGRANASKAVVCLMLSMKKYMKQQISIMRILLD